MRRLASLVVLPLFLFACGDDDDGASDIASGGGDFCDRATLVDERFNELEESFEGSEVPDSAVFEEAADTLEELSDGAPDQVGEDLETIADGAREIGGIFGEIDFSDPAALEDPDNAARLADIGERMEGIGEEVEAATGRVETYLEEECGISLDDSDDDDTTESTEE